MIRQLSLTPTRLELKIDGKSPEVRNDKNLIKMNFSNSKSRNLRHYYLSNSKIEQNKKVDQLQNPYFT